MRGPIEREVAFVLRSAEMGGGDLLTSYGFPKQQWKTIRTTNGIEQLNGEFRRLVKAQGSLPRVAEPRATS